MLHGHGIRHVGRTLTYQRLSRSSCCPYRRFTSKLPSCVFSTYMDRRIRRYIRAKQKLIKLLEEQKQAII